MKLMSVLSGKGFVMYNKQLAKTVSVNAAIIFGQLCASYESFNRKGMLTIKNKKEYFFLTSEKLQEETALTYKQQLKAVKDLEQVGYIETKIMGVPSKKYFYITDKIVQELFNEGKFSSDKKEDLGSTSNQEAIIQKVTPSYDQMESLGVLKGNGKPVQKGSSIKEKNKKEKTKNKISSNNREIIDKELSEKYPDRPFEEIKKEILNDDTLIITTDKQYSSLMNYRLKNWKPLKKRSYVKNKSIIRKELVPDWLHKREKNEDEKTKMNDQQFELEKLKLEAELKELALELNRSSH
ncbi:hypothetical protein [Priestia megaterium]|uniref:hypothetical protein n=1 Tax=Priestia megaterium TaxID=1404 RepID=UPI002FFED5CF